MPFVFDRHLFLLQFVFFDIAHCFFYQIFHIEKFFHFLNLF